jgi:ClpP class serine protease
MGSEALRKGLIDELGGKTTAYEKAAEMAHITHYRVEDLNELAELPEYNPYFFFSQSADGRSTAYPKEAGIYLLFIPPTER